MVGSIGQAPASSTAASCFCSRARMSCGSFIGSVSPGAMSVVASSGAPCSASSSWVTRWSGTRNPMVRREGCDTRRGTSRVASRMKVKGPGVPSLSSLN